MEEEDRTINQLDQLDPHVLNDEDEAAESLAQKGPVQELWVAEEDVLAVELLQLMADRYSFSMLTATADLNIILK